MKKELISEDGAYTLDLLDDERGRTALLVQVATGETVTFTQDGLAFGQYTTSKELTEQVDKLVKGMAKCARRARRARRANRKTMGQTR